MATAIQILCVIAYKGGTTGGGTTAEVVSRSLRTNPVVVRRLLKRLEHEGLVEIRPGKDGGVRLRRTPSRITLDQIHAAVEDAACVFAQRPVANPGCPVGSRLPGLLAPLFGAVDAGVAGTLKKTTLAKLLKALA